METHPDSVLVAINHSLQDGWQAKLNQDGRLYYIDHNSRVSQWIPPPTCWFPKDDGLPYGWEEAMDKNARHYYINHVTRTTTREDPYDVEDIPPVEREVTLLRDMMLGFGFIAGSEKPVVVRSVTEGGPSVGKLLPGDKILRLNGEDVKTKDGPYIIERIRQSSETIRLTVIQPYIDKTGLKSSFLSANKKQKLKTKPSKVRFADNIKAASVGPGKTPPSLVYLPSVLKVYLENGQTKSFKYDNKTSVKDVLRNLKEKLTLRSMEHFSLVVQNMRQSECSSKFTILQEDETLIQIASRPGSEHWKCLLRVTFAPQDAYDLLSRDSKAFDYFYIQCCNDIINERFIDDLDNDKAVRLAALQIQQHFLSSKQSAKVSLKMLEKEDGVERFLPVSVAKQTKSKELKRLISQHIKQSQYLCAPGQKYLTELQAKLHYLKIVCDLRSFGGKYFTGTMVTSIDDYNCTVLIGPKCGITEVISLQDNVMSQLADFNQLTDIQLSPMLINGDCLQVELYVKNETPIILLLTHDDAYDMVTLVNGYYRLFVDSNRSLLPLNYSHSQETAPVYHSTHRVKSADWNYPNDLVSQIVPDPDSEGGWTELETSHVGDGEYIVDLCIGPPAYEEDVVYINRLKSEGRFYPAEASGGIPDGSVMAFTIYEEVEGGHAFTIHRNANNSTLDSSAMSRSDTSTTSATWSNDNSPDQTCFADKIEYMFDIHTPDSESWMPPESRQEMTIDGADENKVFCEMTESTDEAPRQKPLTKHFDVSDTVATSLPLDEAATDGQVKLLHYAIYNDDSLIPVREVCQPPFEDNIDLEETNSPSQPLETDDDKCHKKLQVRDSVVIAHERKVSSVDGSLGRDVSQEPKVRDSKMESFRHLSSFPSSSVDSDIVDLTLGSPSIDTLGENSLHSSTRPAGLFLGNLDNVTEDRTVRDNIDSPVPVSIIDLPSPDQEEEEMSVQADGIQLAGLDGINIRIEQREELPERSLHQDPECESDSGNETISSEIIDNGVTDESGVSHSPSDYFSLIGGQSPTSETIDRDPTPTPEHSDDTQDQDSPQTLCLESDTDSVSTLHGSSPNLSAIEGSEKENETLDKDTETTEDNLDDLICTLLNNPPPRNPEVDVDEELLNAIIPPPSVSDFDIGLIESFIVPPPPPKSPAVSPPTSPPKTPVKVSNSVDKFRGTTAEVSLNGEKWPSGEGAELEVQLPEKESDCQKNSLISPVTGSTVKSRYESVEGKALSRPETCPSLPDKVQALSSDGKLLSGFRKDDTSPGKIGTSVMSSSQDSGFCQLCPGELEQAGMSMDSPRDLDQRDNEKESTLDQKIVPREEIKAEIVTSNEGELSSRSVISLKDAQVSEDCDGDEMCSVKTNNTLAHSDNDKKCSVETFSTQTDSVLTPDQEIRPVSLCSCTAVNTIPTKLNKEPESRTKHAPVIPPKPARPKVARLESVDSLNGGDFDTSGPLETTEMKKVSSKVPEPPPRRRYSPGLAKKAYSIEVGNGSEDQPNLNNAQKPSLRMNPEYGEYLRQIEETSPRVKRSSSFTPKSLPQHPKEISLLSDTKDLQQDLKNREDFNIGQNSVKNGEVTGKTPLGPRLSENLELRNISEISRPVVRSNTFSSGSTYDFNKGKRQAPRPPPNLNELKDSQTSKEIPLSPKEKKSFRTMSGSHASSISKLFSPKRNFAFLHGPKPFSKTDRSDDNVLPSSTPKEKKESKRPRPLRAFRSLSRKDSYDVSMFDHSTDEPSFKESLSLRSVGGLQRPESLNLSDSTDEETSGSLISHRISLFEMKSRSVEDTSKTSHPPLRHSQSLNRATGRPVSYPSSPPHKYPGPGSIHASLPKRPPPPRPNNPPASPRKAMYPSQDSLSSSSSDMIPSPTRLPSPRNYDHDNSSSEDASSPPPLPISMPPVKSRPRALPEHFIPPTQPSDSSESNSTSAKTYSVEIESKEYLSKKSVSEALGDIQLLISQFQEGTQAKESSLSLTKFKVSKDSLMSEVREFTSNTKMLVSSAGQSEDQLVRSINVSMHTLARLCSNSQRMMRVMMSVMQATNLGNKTKEVAVDFSNVLLAAAEAHGKSLQDPTMQLLLRQAQTMATILSALMRTLRMLQS